MRLSWTLEKSKLAMMSSSSSCLEVLLPAIALAMSYSSLSVAFKARQCFVKNSL